VLDNGVPTIVIFDTSQWYLRSHAVQSSVVLNDLGYTGDQLTLNSGWRRDRGINWLSAKGSGMMIVRFAERGSARRWSIIIIPGRKVHCAGGCEASLARITVCTGSASRKIYRQSVRTQLIAIEFLDCTQNRAFLDESTKMC
jgi:hypothetical protein